MIMYNLIPVLIFKHGDDVNTYFLPESVKAAKDDYWENTLKIVMCNIDKNIVEAE